MIPGGKACQPARRGKFARHREKDAGGAHDARQTAPQRREGRQEIQQLAAPGPPYIPPRSPSREREAAKCARPAGSVPNPSTSAAVTIV